ncbi:MAG: ATP-dependent zinc protease [Bacteroidia bacterium]|nr:ATP-dependent zinc protease [Bacteroidia bacterium]
MSTIIGRKEHVSFPHFGNKHLEAKIDTGAYTTSLYCTNIRVQNNVLLFNIAQDTTTTFKAITYTIRTVKSSNGAIEQRYAITTSIRIGTRHIKTLITLANRGEMSTPVLIGRKLLHKKFVVDVSKKYVLETVV